MKRLLCVLGVLALAAGVVFAAEFYSAKRGLDGIAEQIDTAAGRYKSASSAITAAAKPRRKAATPAAPNVPAVAVPPEIEAKVEAKMEKWISLYNQLKGLKK